MPTIYRCIKFEGAEEQLRHQLKRSLSPGIYKLGAVTMSIKDRVDEDPNEGGFWDNLIVVPLSEMTGGGICELNLGE